VEVMDALTQAVLVGSVLNLIGMIIFFQLRDKAWFKKETFKANKINTMNINKIKLDALKKELNVSSKTKVTENQTNDLITGLINKYVPSLIGDDAEQEEGDLVTTGIQLLKEHPEVIDKLKSVLHLDADEENQPLVR
jgi:hypothetical protein